jgi:hypothetical protein
MTLSKLECPTPTVSINNFRIVDGVASCDLSVDLKGYPAIGKDDTGSHQTKLHLYDGAAWKWIAFGAPLFHSAPTGWTNWEALLAGETLSISWNMVQEEYCMVSLTIATECGKTENQLKMMWNGIDIEYVPPDPCAGVVCNPECVGVDRYAMVCKDGVCVRGALMEANSVECGYVKPECAEGDKKPGYICSGGKWVPYTPEQEAGRLYVKFAIPWLDLLPGIPYESWMIIPPGFKVVEG